MSWFSSLNTAVSTTISVFDELVKISEYLNFLNCVSRFKLINSRSRLISVFVG